MMAETYIAIGIFIFALGVLTGLQYAYWVAIRPDDKAREDVRQAEIRARRLAVYREEARREHKGTPYIAPRPSPLEQLLVAIADPHLDDRFRGLADVGNDHDTSSLRADLRVVS